MDLDNNRNSYRYFMQRLQNKCVATDSTLIAQNEPAEVDAPSLVYKPQSEFTLENVKHMLAALDTTHDYKPY